MPSWSRDSSIRSGFSAGRRRSPHPPLGGPFVVAGFGDPGGFLGGRMPLSRPLAEEALQRYANTLGMSLHEAAESVVRVAVANMYAAFTRIISRAGIDP